MACHHAHIHTQRRFILLPLMLLAVLFSTQSSQLPSHGCYWTEACQRKWFGGCGSGHIVVNQSDDCYGLCSESKYPSCLLFHTRFYCCIPESPRNIKKCSHCKNKLDFDVEYICCEDCSDASVLDNSTKVGYCKTGSQLIMELKPQEIFTWVAGPWMRCSLPCDGGVRYRDVGCFGRIEDTSMPSYPVDDSKCHEDEMPPQQESCNMEACVDYSDNETSTSEKRNMSGWLIALLFLLGFLAVGGLAFVGYTYYKRRNLQSHGFVYIMLEGYS